MNRQGFDIRRLNSRQAEVRIDNPHRRRTTASDDERVRHAIAVVSQRVAAATRRVVDQNPRTVRRSDEINWQIRPDLQAS